MGSPPVLRNGDAQLHLSSQRPKPSRPQSDGVGTHQPEGSSGAQPHSLGTRVAWGKLPPRSPTSHAKLSTFPAASTRWTSEREEVPGMGRGGLSHPFPSHPILSHPSCSHRASRRRLSVLRGEPGTWHNAGGSACWPCWGWGSGWGAPQPATTPGACPVAACPFLRTPPSAVPPGPPTRAARPPRTTASRWALATPASCASAATPPTPGCTTTPPSSPTSTARRRAPGGRASPWPSASSTPTPSTSRCGWVGEGRGAWGRGVLSPPPGAGGSWWCSNSPLLVWGGRWDAPHPRFLGCEEGDAL